MRNADYELDDEEISDLMVEMEGILWERERGNIIRLEIQTEVDKNPQDFTKLMDVSDEAVFRIKGPIDLKFVDKIKNLYPNPDLHYERFRGQITGFRI